MTFFSHKCKKTGYFIVILKKKWNNELTNRIK
jgi:hypothetical protein